MTEHPNLAAALVAALADLTVVDKGRTANAGTFKYDYASLEDAVKLTRPVLAEHGVVALNPLHDHGSGLACTVILLHTSGDRMDLGPFPFPHGRDAQATGSMVTYHRRYALLAALGMAAGDDDDDGAAAKPRQSDHTETVPASGFLATFNELAPDVKNKVLPWLRERGHKPTSVPEELLSEVTAFIATLGEPEGDAPAAGPAASPSVADRPALGSVKK